MKGGDNITVVYQGLKWKMRILCTAIRILE